REGLLAHAMLHGPAVGTPKETLMRTLNQLLRVVGAAALLTSVGCEGQSRSGGPEPTGVADATEAPGSVAVAVAAATPADSRYGGRFEDHAARPWQFSRLDLFAKEGLFRGTLVVREPGQTTD